MTNRTPLPIDVSGWNDKAQARFDAKTRWVPATGCLIWTGFLDPGGYGTFKWGSRAVRAHRLAWTLANGPIPDGLQLDHLCRVRCCINQCHLEPVDHRTNALRGHGPTSANATKTHCNRGHLLTPDNLLPSALKVGSRSCATCSNDRDRLAREARLSLGMSQAQYRAIYGNSIKTHIQVLASVNRERESA